MDYEQQINRWSEIVAKAWQDDKFKQRLMAEPATVLKDFGLEVPRGVQLRVVENTDRVVHLTLPARPREGELSDDELAGVAGGVVSIEYLLIGTILGLALAVGVTAVAPARDTSGSKNAPTTIKKR